MPIRMTEKSASKLGKQTKKLTKPNPLSEADIQALIVSWLERTGHIVLVTGQYGETPTRRVNTKGLPDLVIHHKEWPAGLNLLVEVKRPKTGRLSKDQEELHAIGVSWVVYSLEEMIEVLKKFEGSWDKLFTEKNQG